MPVTHCSIVSLNDANVFQLLKDVKLVLFEIIIDFSAFVVSPMPLIYN